MVLPLYVRLSAGQPSQKVVVELLQQRRLLLKQVGLEMTLEGAEGHIWCSKIGRQTVPCSWSIDGEAVLTGSSPDTLGPRTLTFAVRD